MEMTTPQVKVSKYKLFFKNVFFFFFFFFFFRKFQEFKAKEIEEEVKLEELPAKMEFIK